MILFRDINCFGGFGRQGYGYRVSELKGHIGEILGLTKEHRVIIVGAGNIGCAVARYPSFSREGFHTIAMFDVAEDKVGRNLDEIPVYHMDELDGFLRDNPVDIAVLALPKRVAQDTLQQLYDGGVRAIWNFVPLDLAHPEDMLVVNVHLMDSLQQLSYRMAHIDHE